MKNFLLHWNRFIAQTLNFQEQKQRWKMRTRTQHNNAFQWNKQNRSIYLIKVLNWELVTWRKSAQWKQSDEPKKEKISNLFNILEYFGKIILKLSWFKIFSHRSVNDKLHRFGLSCFGIIILPFCVVYRIDGGIRIRYHLPCFHININQSVTSEAESWCAQSILYFTAHIDIDWELLQ